MPQASGPFTADLGLSLDQFLVQAQQQCPDLPQALLPIFRAMASAGKAIHHVVRRLDLADIVGTQGAFNPSGDEQQKLDVMAHDRCVQALAATGEVCAVISEEQEDLIALPHSGEGRYVLALDPLDGSPNIDVNAPIGTIFSVYRRLSPSSAAVQPADVLQAGQQQVAAGYILYGTSTMLVYTAGQGVHGFTYEPTKDDFFLAHPSLQIPEEGISYAVNDSHAASFPTYVQDYLQQCRRKGYAARYMGALVADFHRHLIQGGIYLYPPIPQKPQGKLRLVLECNALAFIAEQAGGMATTGQQAILSIQPTAIHQRTPLYMGSKHMVQRLLLAAKSG
ncbi:MAG: class 1 fructose-bisphosphatase [Roseivirga sp.]